MGVSRSQYHHLESNGFQATARKDSIDRLIVYLERKPLSLALSLETVSKKTLKIVLDHLKKNEALATLEFSCKSMTSKKIIVLSQALIQHPSLRRVHLTLPTCTPSVAQALSKIHFSLSLGYFGLYVQSWTEEGMHTFVKELKRGINPGVELDLRGNDFQALSESILAKLYELLKKMGNSPLGKSEGIDSSLAPGKRMKLLFFCKKGSLNPESCQAVRPGLDTMLNKDGRAKMQKVTSQKAWDKKTRKVVLDRFRMVKSMNQWKYFLTDAEKIKMQWDGDVEKLVRSIRPRFIKMSLHAQARVFERDISHYMIQHAFAKGRLQPTKNGVCKISDRKSGVTLVAKGNTVITAYKNRTTYRDAFTAK